MATQLQSTLVSDSPENPASSLETSQLEMEGLLQAVQAILDAPGTVGKSAGTGLLIGISGR